ncbi:MAG: UDP-N-acetylglucosamine 2-epimerase (non-hydrolyzing) [Pseudomonadota bacterium]
MKKCRIHLIAGTRPNVMKIAPLFKVLDRQDWCTPLIVFLAQHYSENMGEDVFRQLGVDAEITSIPLETGELGQRIGSIVTNYAKQIDADMPDIVVVPGDVDVSMGAAIAAKRAHIPLVHLEAGLRSQDQRMPEELNRLMIDSISDILWTPSEAATGNLIYDEGAAPNKVHFVGNIMIDSLVSVVDSKQSRELMAKYSVEEKNYAVATFHRPSNVDDRANLERVFDLLIELNNAQQVIFPAHPRTRKKLEEAGLLKTLVDNGVSVIEPAPYAQFINLMATAKLVVTDSGGIQEETTYLNVPCLTLRENTERPITVTHGSNTLVNFSDVAEQANIIANGGGAKAQSIPLWDGRTAYRCAHLLKAWWTDQAHSF